MLEIVGKLRFDGPQWLAVQQNLYVAFGPIGGCVEVLGIVLTWMTLFSRRRGTREWRWTLAAAVATTVGLIEWALVVSPMNGVLNGWTAASLPGDWMAVRNQWEIGHGVQAALFAFGFSALVVAALTEAAPRSG